MINRGEMTSYGLSLGEYQYADSYRRALHVLAKKGCSLYQNC
jgi:hypothetical protein